jgi:ribonuclease Z
LERGFFWSDSRLCLQGFSLAGVTTTIGLPEFQTLVDVGQGLPFQVGYPVIALTHGHLDHASGVPYLLGQRSLFSQGPALILSPHGLLGPLRDIIQIWEKIECHQFSYELRGVRPGDRLELDKGRFIEVFQTHHRIDSVGYAFGRTRTKLRADLKGMGPDAICKVRDRGESATESEAHVEVAITGDTTSEFVHSTIVQHARVVVVEVTFWEERRSAEQARTWGHIHSAELPSILSKLRAEKVLIKHVSGRHSTAEIERLLTGMFSPEERSRVEIFPRPG